MGVEFVELEGEKISSIVIHVDIACLSIKKILTHVWKML